MGLQANSSWTTYFDVPTGPLLLHLTKSLVEKTWWTDPSVLTLWRLHRADVLTLLLISSLSAHGVATGGHEDEHLMIPWPFTANQSSVLAQSWIGTNTTHASPPFCHWESSCVFFCFVLFLCLRRRKGPFIFRFKLFILTWTLRQCKKRFRNVC